MKLPNPNGFVMGVILPALAVASLIAAFLILT